MEEEERLLGSEGGGIFSPSSDGGDDDDEEEEEVERVGFVITALPAYNDASLEPLSRSPSISRHNPLGVHLGTNRQRASLFFDVPAESITRAWFFSEAMLGSMR